MENRRFILIALLGVVIFFLYQAWQQDYVRNRAAPAATAPVTEASTPATEPAPLGTATTGSEAVPTAVPAASPARIAVYTDLFSAEIDSQGAELRRVELLGYPISKKRPEVNLALLDDRDGHYFILQSGIAGTDRPLASHLNRYATDKADYRLDDGSDVLEVPFTYTDASGYTVSKVYRFRRGSYQVELEQTLANHSGAPLQANAYARFVRTPIAAGEEPPFVHSFMGVGIYEHKDSSDGYRFHKMAFKKLDEAPYEKQQPGGWIAMLQHYFAAAILPAQDENNSYSARPGKDKGYVTQYVGPGVSVADQSEQHFATRLFLGPKLQDGLEAVAPGFELTVDYGILTPISEPLFWVMAQFHKYTGNWGWSIILLTLLVKAVFYKLSEAQYRSMAKMRKFSPRIQDIKERYGDDRERMSKAMMELYKKEGFNPLAGCWPMLVQFPVFIALYWVLVESVELRQADFALWINDLTSPDPFYVLPVLYGLSMWFMQRLSGQNAAMDPTQQKVMQVMPIGLTAFFAFFPSGLVLYWVVSNSIGIAQQWYITRKLEREGLGKPKTA